MGNERFGRPSNPEYLLRPGELLETVRGKLRVVAYEDVIVGGPAAAVQRICALNELSPPGGDAGTAFRAPPRFARIVVLAFGAMEVSEVSTPAPGDGPIETRTTAPGTVVKAMPASPAGS